MAEELRGLRIILAGGSGGLGSATAELLAEEGAELIVSYATNAEKARKLSGIARVLRADLRESADRECLLDEAEDFYGLVVFSGDPARARDGEQAEDLLRRSHEVNYLGPILLAREAAARLKERGTPGSIVLFGSMQAAGLFPGSTAYAGQKAALVQAAKVLAKECRGANIRVNAICPGVMAAGMALASISAGKYEHLLKNGMVPRYGAPADVARAVRFLLEPDNYITGQALGVDGGATL